MTVTKMIHDQTPDNCILAGWSLGGLIATTLAYQYPHKYQKLIVAANTPRFSCAPAWQGVDATEMTAFYTQAKDNPARLLSTFIRNVARPSKAILSHLLAQAWQPDELNTPLFYLDLLFNSDVRACHQALTQPTLQLFGSQDSILPDSIARQMQIHYPRHSTRLFANAGHAFFVSHANDVAQSLIQFIEGES
jgi:pimeloyl-[acyl-carrier protein] methyl ester esterase